MIKISDKYIVTRELGKGGFGTVYLAEHVDLGAKYAIKLLNFEISQDEGLIIRFKREAEVLMRMVHRNSVQLRDFGRTADGLYYMAMDFCSGTSLKDVLRTSSPMPLWRVLSIVIQVLEVFEQAHSMGIVHRDIKPDNIMIEVDGRGREIPKVLDFGIAKLKAASGHKKGTTITKEGSVIGTPLYMSPEQATGLEIDHRSDIYSLGMMMYEMLAGIPPFQGNTLDILMKQVNVYPAPFSEAVPHLNIPSAVEEVVFKAIQKKKENRFQRAEKFCEVCKILWENTAKDPSLLDTRKEKTEDEDFVAHISDRLKVYSAPSPRKSPLLVAGLGVVLFLAVLLGFIIYRKNTGSSTPVSKGTSSSSGSQTPPASPAPEVVLEPVPPFTKSDTVSLSGRVKHFKGEGLFFESSQVFLDGDHFKLQIPLKKEGKNTFLLSLRKGKEKIKTYPIQIVFDQTLPQILIHGHGSLIHTREKILLLKGTVKEPYLKNFSQNGKTISLGRQGIFTIPIEIAQAKTTIALEAEDMAGNRSPLKVTIVQDLEGPSFHLTYPRETVEKSFTLQGEVEDLSGIKSLQIQNKIQNTSLPFKGNSPSKVSLNQSVPLSLGVNQITLVARDTLGNERKKVIEIRRFYEAGRSIEKLEGLIKSNHLEEAYQIFTSLSHYRDHLQAAPRARLLAIEKKLLSFLKDEKVLSCRFLYQNRRVPITSSLPLEKIKLTGSNRDYFIYKITAHSKQKENLYTYIFQINESQSQAQCWLAVPGENKIAPLLPGKKENFDLGIGEPSSQQKYYILCIFARRQIPFQTIQKKTKEIQIMASAEKITQAIVSFLEEKKIPFEKRSIQVEFQ